VIKGDPYGRKAPNTYATVHSEFKTGCILSRKPNQSSDKRMRTFAVCATNESLLRDSVQKTSPLNTENPVQHILPRRAGRVQSRSTREEGSGRKSAEERLNRSPNLLSRVSLYVLDSLKREGRILKLGWSTYSYIHHWGLFLFLHGGCLGVKRKLGPQGRSEDLIDENTEGRLVVVVDRP